jgi:hypothetical protein
MQVGGTRRRVSDSVEPHLTPEPERTDPCGAGQATFGPETQGSGLQQRLEREDQSTWLAALQTAREPRARAAGLFLDDSDTSKDQLARDALSSGDPAVYALALAHCRGATEGPCSQLSAAEWAVLEPDNGVPWLLIASAARARAAWSEEAQAFEHLSKAQHFEPYTWSVLTFGEALLPGEKMPVARLRLSVFAFGVEAATMIPYQEISRHCSVEALQEALTRQQCAAVAEILVSKSGTLLDLGVGQRIGAKAGWSRARVQSLQEHWQALQGVAIGAWSPDSASAQEGSCAWIERQNSWLREVSVKGERAALEEQLLLSGLGEAEGARLYGERMQKLREQAEQEHQAN